MVLTHGSELKVSDWVSKPNWSGQSFRITKVFDRSVFLRNEERGTDHEYNRYGDWILVTRPEKPKKKSGFGKWISKHEHG